MILKCLTLLVATMGAATAFALDFEVAVWRGETRTERLPDYAALGLGAAPSGVVFRVGTVLPVRYLEDPAGTHYGEVADRVVWGSKASGFKVLEITANPSAHPGCYRCGSLTLKIIDRVLPSPREWRYYLDIWQHPWSVARIHGLKPYSKEHYDAMRPLWRMLASAGQKTITTTLVEQPWNHQNYDAYGSMIGVKKNVAKVGGEWKFDYSVFDEYVTFALSCGLGPDISCYSLCPWANNPGEDYWRAFLPDFARHLKAKGWLDHTYVAMDELSREQVERVVKFVHEQAPGMKIAMAGSCDPSKFAGIRIDSYSQYMGHVSDTFLKSAQARRGEGLLTTYYVCGGPAHPNTMMSNDREEAFWVGAYPAFAGLDGFLRWAWNNWPQDPLVDASCCHWPAGDAFLVYPDGSPSLRFLELKNGIQTAEKIRLLKKAGENTAALDKVKILYDATAAQKNKCNFRDIRKKTLAAVNVVQ